MDVYTGDVDGQETIDLNEWSQIFTTSAGTTVSIRLKDMGKRSGHMFWVKMDHSKDPSVKARQSLTRYRTDCAAETLTMLATVQYDARGRIIASGDFPTYQQQTRAVIPGSAGEAILQNACPWTEIE
ncbi:MAG: hypothetical protein EON59_04060 [Alphaproteobacteria bacterium]|nr:MAG: hypothetical protein EON59_04060 [Alphaproteobacteria bacterium]